MANVNIKFNGKDFLLSCEDGQEEHLEELSLNLTEKFKKNEFIFFLIYRFVGGIPFFISNILPTIFNVKVRNFFLGSIIGMTPQLFVGASLGAGLSKILEENSEVPSILELIFSPDIYLPILGIIILVIICGRGDRNYNLWSERIKR